MRSATVSSFLRNNPASCVLAFAAAFLALIPEGDGWGGATLVILMVVCLCKRKTLASAFNEALFVRMSLLGMAFTALVISTVALHGSSVQITVFMFTLIPLFAAQVAREPDARRALSLGAAVGCVMLLVAGVAGLWLKPADRPGGFWGIPTVFGMAGCMLTAAALLATAMQERRATRLAYALAVLAGLGAVAMSGARGALLGIFAAGVVVAAGLAWPRLSKQERMAAVVLALVGVVVAGVLVGPRFVSGVQGVQAFVFSGVMTGSEGERLTFWRATPQLVAESPWIGIGLRDLGSHLAAIYAGVPNAPPGAYLLRISHMHNDWLNILVACGVPAFLIFIAWQASALQWLARRVPAGRARVTATVAVALAYMCIALVDTPFAWSRVMLTLMVAVALVASPPPAAVAGPAA